MKIRHIANFLTQALQRKRSVPATDDHRNVGVEPDQKEKKDIVVKLKNRKVSDDLYPLW